MGREFELKFAATPEQQEAIARSFGEFLSITMETTYYDTPGRALSDRKITLRRRLENGRSICTLKTPLQGRGRGEWDVEETDIGLAAIELCKLSGREDLLLLLSEGLAPVCGARFSRQAKTLTLADCTLELALDRGVLLGGGREQPLCEVEAELKGGSETAVTAFAKKLAREYGLKPEKDSKFRRALALAEGE